MIIGSILLVLVAAGLLAAGMMRGSELYYYLSIVSSALAALALVAGVRQAAAKRDLAADDDFDRPRPAVPRPGPAVGRVAVPLADAGDAPPMGDPDAVAEPSDEPPAQFATPIEQAQMAQLQAEVAVVDGRPRYHVVECPHLASRSPERLPVQEAIDLGFTPCGACEPVAVLLAALPRR